MSECIGYLMPQFLDDLTERVEALGTRWTKRKIASLFAQNFDPVGLFAPIITTSKLILQRCWKEASVAIDLKKSWDVEITNEDLLNDIRKFITELYELRSFRIPRLCLKQNAKLRRLVIFSDASQKAYGACGYLTGRTDVDDISPSVHLIFAKSRLTPSKQAISVARAELLGACLGTQIALECTVRLSKS